MLDLEQTIKHSIIETPFVVCTNFLRENGNPVFAVVYHVTPINDFHLIFSRGYRGCPPEFQQHTVVCAGMKASLHVARGNRVRSNNNQDWLVRMKENMWVPLKWLFQMRTQYALVGLFMNVTDHLCNPKSPLEIVPINTPLRVTGVKSWVDAPYQPKKGVIRFHLPCTLIANVKSGGQYDFATLVAVHPIQKTCLLLPWGAEQSMQPMFCNIKAPLQKYKPIQAQWFIRECPGHWIPLEQALVQHVFGNPPHARELLMTGIKQYIDRTPPPVIPYSVFHDMEDAFLKTPLGATWGHRIDQDRANPFFGIHMIPATYPIHDNPMLRIAAPISNVGTAKLPSAVMHTVTVEPFFQMNRAELLSWESQVRDAIVPSPGYSFLSYSIQIHDEHIKKERVLAPQEPFVKAKEPKTASFWIAQPDDWEQMQPRRIINPDVVEAAEKVSAKFKRTNKEILVHSDDEDEGSRPVKKYKNKQAIKMIQLEPEEEQTEEEEDPNWILCSQILLLQSQAKVSSESLK